jgi:hypothetical protein
MNGTTPNARNGRGNAGTRRPTRPGVVSLAGTPRRTGVNRPAVRDDEEFTGGALTTTVDGANALDLTVTPDEIELEPTDLIEDAEPVRAPALPEGQPPARSPRKRAVPAPGRLRVAPPLPVSVPRAPFLALVLVIVVAGVLGVLVINTKINENAFHLDDLRNEQGQLDVQEQRLAQDLADKKTPGNLAAAARRLGLVPAGTPAYIRLPDGQVLGVPQPANDAPSVTAGSATR